MANEEQVSGLLSSSVAFLTQCLSFPFYGGHGPAAGDTALPWKGESEACFLCTEEQRLGQALVLSAP